MGAHLSEPKVEKESQDESHSHLEFGVSGMQGWRVSMEDAHCTIADVDGKSNALFGVFDGHGGDEVAKYCAENFHKFLLDNDAYTEGNVKIALKDSFMNIDQALTTDEVIEELKAIAGLNGPEEEEEEDRENEVAMLLEDANMPMEQLLERFKENVKEKLRGSGLLVEEEEEEEEEKEDVKKSELTNGSSEAHVPNGHADGSSGKSKKSRKQSKPTKRVENENGDSGSTSTTSSNEEKEASASSSSSTVNGSSAGSSSSSSSAIEEGSSSSSKEVENEEDTEDPDYEGGAVEDDDENESEDDDEEDDDDDSDEDDDEEDDDEEFEDSEGVEFQHGTGEEVGKDSGTTAIVALVYNNKLYVANVGDSRCVLCRNGKSLDMSIDHKPEDEIEKKRIEAAGAKITSDGRVNGGLNLTRAIGDHSYKQNKDLSPEEQAITALPDIQEVELTRDDDFMVLACDGIWNVMTSEEVIDFVKEKLQANEKLDEKIKLSQICEELFDRCIAPNTNNDGTGCDNMTCMIVRFKDSRLKNGHHKREHMDTEEDVTEKTSKRAKLT